MLILWCGVREHPMVRKLDEPSYAGKLLAKEPGMEADFKHNPDKHNPEAASKSKAAGTARSVWGPGT